MEQKTKRDLAIITIVSEFETKLPKGDVGYLAEKTYMQIVDYYLEENKLKRALEVVDLAISQYAYRSEFYLIKAKILLQLNKPKRALKILKLGEKVSPFEIDIQLLKARALSILQEYDQALDIINTLKDSCAQSDLADVLITEAKFFELRKEYSLMYQCLSEALLLNMDDEDLYEQLWTSVELSKNYINCIELNKKIINKKPYSYLAWFNLGHAYSFTGEYEMAIDAFEYSFIINPEFENGYLDCADICVQMKNFEKALKILTESLGVVENECDTLLLISYCQIQLNNFKEAKYNLYKALKLDPYNDEVYFNLGICYTKEGQWQNAINSFHKAIAIEDSTEDYYLYLGLAYYELGSFDKAGQFLRKATAIAPEQSAFWSEYAKFLIKQGKSQLAIDILHEADEYTFGADILYCRSVAYLKTGRKNEAFDILSEALMEGFEQHTIMYDIDPELALDQDILSIIRYYKSENEELL